MPAEEIFVKKLLIISLLVLLISIPPLSIPDVKADTLRTTTDTITPNPVTTVIASPVTFHARIFDSSSGTKSVPTGTVSWSDGGAGGSFNSTSCTLSPISGSTTTTSLCNISYTPPASTGPVTINGTYSGDSIHSTSSGTSALTVTLRGSSTTLSPNPDSAALGVSVTYSAKVLDPSPGTKILPAGTISWSDGGAGGSFNSTSCTLSRFGTSLSTSICAVVYTPPGTPGPITITGSYPGDSTHSSSAGSAALTVTLRATKTTILPTQPSVTIGVPITFSSKVLDSSSGTKIIPTGTVSWSDGGGGGSFNSTSCTLSQYNSSPSTSICAVTYTPSTNPIIINGTYSGDSTHSVSFGIASSIAPPSPPQNLQATAGSFNITLTWQPPSNNGGASITGYKVYRSTSSGAEVGYVTIGNVTSFTNTGLTGGTTYFYKVSAVNTLGTSLLSNEASATPPTVPSAPQNLQATAGPLTVALTWDAPSTNGGSPITGYKIYRSTSSGTEAGFASLGNVTSYTNTGLTAGVTYFYKVKAVNSLGVSAYSNEASATPTTPPTAPSAPQNLQATAGIRNATLTWDAPSSNGGSAIIGYKVYRSTSSGAETGYVTLGNVTSYTNIGLTPGVTYFYKVLAVNSIGLSPLSNEASATP